MLSEFSGKIIVLWLRENFDTNVTKVKISNYSGTLTIPAVYYNVNQRWKFTTEDGVLRHRLWAISQSNASRKVKWILYRLDINEGYLWI